MTKNITMREVVKRMRKEGYKVSFYVRKDGGIRITKINGQSFKGSKGNVRARGLMNVQLSEARVRSLKKLVTPTGKGSYDLRRKDPLSDELKKRIRRLQQIYRNRDYAGGKPTIRNYRYNLQEFGEKEAERLLQQSELYIQGIVYDANIDYLKMEIEKLGQAYPEYSTKFDEIKDRLESMKGILRYDPTYIKLVDDRGPIYELKYSRIKPEEAIRRIKEILDSNNKDIS